MNSYRYTILVNGRHMVVVAAPCCCDEHAVCDEQVRVVCEAALEERAGPGENVLEILSVRGRGGELLGTVH